MRREYSLSDQEQALHKIINDTRIAPPLDTVEIVQELVRINFVLDQIHLAEIGDFPAYMREYKRNLLEFLEGIR